MLVKNSKLLMKCSDAVVGQVVGETLAQNEFALLLCLSLFRHKSAMHGRKSSHVSSQFLGLVVAIAEQTQG